MNHPAQAPTVSKSGHRLQDEIKPEGIRLHRRRAKGAFNGRKIGSRSRALATTIAALTTLLAGLPAAKAVNTVLFWDADGTGTNATGGTGLWDTTSSLWRLGTGTGTLQTYTNTSPSTITADFAGTAGTVTLADGANLNVNTIVFGINGYTINPGSSSTIVLSAGAGATNATPTITTGVTAGTGNTETINAILDGTAGLAKSNDIGTLVLGGANIYSGGTTLNGGTLRVTNTTGSATGTGTVTLNGGTLAGGFGGSTFGGAATSGFISGDVTAGSAAHTIAPGGVGTFGHFALNNLTTNSNTTLSFDLTAPETATDDELLLSGTATIGAGTQIAIGGAPSANGYYRLINSANLNLASFTIATAAPANHAYVLASGSNGGAGDAGWTDLAVVTTQSWKANTTGSWSAATSWAGGVVPNGIGDIALAATSGTNVATLDTAVTLGKISVTANNVAWTINSDGTHALTMQNVPGQTALISSPARAILTINPNVVIGSSDGLKIAASGDTGGSGVTIGGSVTGSGPLTLDTTGSGAISGTFINLNGGVNNAGTLTVNGQTTFGHNTALQLVTITNLGSSVTSVTKNGGNSLLLTGTSGTFGHAVTINGGILQLTNPNAVDLSSATFTVGNGAILAVTHGGAGFTTAQVDTLLTSSNVSFNGGLLGIDTTNDTSGLTYGTNITDAGNGQKGLAKLGTNTLSLTGTNTYSGQTVIAGGTLSVSSLNSVNGGTPLLTSSSLGAPTTVANGTIILGLGDNAGSLQYTGSGETTDRVISLNNFENTDTLDASGTGLLKFTSNLIGIAGGAAKALTLAGSGSGEFAGNIGDVSGAIGITKSGAGKWTLSGTNTYTGVTNVNAGTLLVTGSISGTVKVAAGATLGGSGTVGAITATSASNAGHVSTGGGHILTSASTEGGTKLSYDFQFNQTGSPTYSSSTASGNDLLRLTSSTPFTFGSLDSSNPVNIYLTSANNGDVFRGGFFTDQLTASALLAAVQAAQFHYFVLNASGSVTFNGASYAALDPSLISLSIFSESAANFASGTVAGTELQISVIPEPATGGILLSGFGMLVGLQRIRRRTRSTFESERKARR